MLHGSGKFFPEAAVSMDARGSCNGFNKEILNPYQVRKWSPLISERE